MASKTTIQNHLQSFFESNDILDPEKLPCHAFMYQGHEVTVIEYRSHFTIMIDNHVSSFQKEIRTKNWMEYTIKELIRMVNALSS